MRIVRNGETVEFTDTALVTKFAGYFSGHSANPKGEWSLRFGAEKAQTDNIVPLLDHLGGTMFEITIRKVPRSELPE